MNFKVRIKGVVKTKEAEAESRVITLTDYETRQAYYGAWGDSNYPSVIFKVSDQIYTENDLIGATCVDSNGTTHTITEVNSSESFIEATTASGAKIHIVPADYTNNADIFFEAGLYFIALNAQDLGDITIPATPIITELTLA